MYRIYLSLLILLAAAIVACSNQPVYPTPAVSGRDAVIYISALKHEVPQFYTYRYQGKNINFFVLKLNDKVLSFFDACASCYPHKQGYHYDDGAVTCRFCNMKFPVSKLEKGLGGCYPIKIEGKVENGKYVIPVATLEETAEKF